MPVLSTSVFGPMNVVYPRVDAIRSEQRLDPYASIVPAYLGGQPVMLARLDPATRPAGMPIDYTVPISVSRLRRAIDIERGYDTGPFEPSLVDDVSLMTSGLTGVGQWAPSDFPIAPRDVVWIVVGGVLGYARARSKREDPLVGALMGAGTMAMVVLVFQAF